MWQANHRFFASRAATLAFGEVKSGGRSEMWQATFTGRTGRGPKIWIHGVRMRGFPRPSLRPGHGPPWRPRPFPVPPGDRLGAPQPRGGRPRALGRGRARGRGRRLALAGLVAADGEFQLLKWRSCGSHPCLLGGGKRVWAEMFDWIHRFL